jgi:AraC-like DNA-binding protein
MFSSTFEKSQKIPLMRFTTLRLFLLQAKKQQLTVDDWLTESGCPDVLTEENPALYLAESCLLRFLEKLSKSITPSEFSEYLQGCAHLLVTQLLDKNYAHCQTLIQALELLTQQVSSYSNHQIFTLNEQGLFFAESNGLFKQQAYWSESFTLLLMIQFIRQFTVSNWSPKAVYFKNDNLPLLTEHLKLSSIQVYFSQPQLSIEIEGELLNSPLFRPKLVNSKIKFHSLPILSFKQNVEYALAPYIGCNNCSEDQFCWIVGLHKRQLQRLLKAEGSSFKKIKEQLSIDFAIKHIQENRYSMTDIAEHLGYFSASQFSRAVKRVTGKTPLQHRLISDDE